MRDHLVQEGFSGELPDPALPFLALQIVAMGWSWAVWVAQMVIPTVILGLAKFLEGALTGVTITADRLSVQGRPAPAMGEEPRQRAVGYGYIDDYG